MLTGSAVLALGALAVASQADQQQAFYTATLNNQRGRCITGTYIGRSPSEVVLGDRVHEDKQKHNQVRSQIVSIEFAAPAEVDVTGPPQDAQPVTSYPCAPSTQDPRAVRRGPRGLAGPAGPAGPQGPEGQHGQAGERGARGATGSSGQRGATGNRGPRGRTGNPGPRGRTGSRGAQGATGNRGTRGSIGPRGQRGPRGRRGPKGLAREDREDP